MLASIFFSRNLSSTCSVPGSMIGAGTTVLIKTGTVPTLKGTPSTRAPQDCFLPTRCTHRGDRERGGQSTGCGTRDRLLPFRLHCLKLPWGSLFSAGPNHRRSPGLCFASSLPTAHSHQPTHSLPSPHRWHTPLCFNLAHTAVCSALPLRHPPCPDIKSPSTSPGLLFSWVPILEPGTPSHLVTQASILEAPSSLHPLPPVHLTTKSSQLYLQNWHESIHFSPTPPGPLQSICSRCCWVLTWILVSDQCSSPLLWKLPSAGGDLLY